MSGILSTHESSRPVYAAGFAAGLIVLAVIALLPEARMKLPVIQAFLPMYVTTVFLIDGMTAYLLIIQYRSSREPFLGALAGAYGFVMVVSAVQVLIFPGALSAGGLLGATPQTAPFMWLVWHTGYPAFVLAALVVQAVRLRRDDSAGLGRVSLVLMTGGPLAAAALAWVVIAGGGRLPHLISGETYHTPADFFSWPVVASANVVAMAACLWITRLRDLLSLWVGVALLTSIGDAVLMLVGGARYTLGWYAGQLVSVLSSSVVLCVLIFEFGQLYDRLLTSSIRLTQRALYDGLTGAFNRGYFIEQFPREMRRAAREQAPLSLLMIDVDHFKSYNDVCGHQMGDECLIAIVRAIHKVTRRPGDFIARYGGEEFALVLPRTDAAGAKVMAEAVRAEVCELALRRGEMALGLVTVSLGIATFDPAVDVYEADELVRRADLALYQAKRDGRDTARAYDVSVSV
jgi:diguanylate cyclase (GGDEF)-like protein